MLDLIAYKNTHVPAENMLENANFKKGDFRWIAQNATMEETDEGLRITGDGTLKTTQTSQLINTIENNVYFLSVRVKIESEFIEKIALSLTTFGNRFSETSDFVNGDYINLSGIYNEGAIRQASRIRIYADFESGEASIDQSFSVIETNLINLTETFGKGNEPTTEQMDKLLESRFDNGWFDGTKNLFNAKDFMNVYHKKTKELENAIISLGGELP